MCGYRDGFHPISDSLIRTGNKDVQRKQKRVSLEERPSEDTVRNVPSASTGREHRRN